MQILLEYTKYVGGSLIAYHLLWKIYVIAVIRLIVVQLTKYANMLSGVFSFLDNVLTN